VDENPGTRVCEEAAALCRKGECGFVVGLGGGSAMDAAKVIAVLAVNDQPCATLFGNDQYTLPPLPIIAVPTTAGTGSEVTPYSVLVDEAASAKRTVRGAALFPAVALLDPELTVSMPRGVTIATGLDALSQAMEGMVSRQSCDMADPLALEAIGLVRRWLPVAAEHPESLEARGAMLHAAMLSGMVIAQTGTTVVHGMGYYYTLRHGIAHGLANGLLLAPVFAFNALQLPGKVAAICGALGCPASPAHPEVVAQTVAGEIHALFAALKMSPASGDYGVSEADADAHAADIAGDPYRFRNQPGTLDEGVFKRLFRASQAGSAFKM
jgi:alcohol dehydrogenase class IV